ncbi:acyl-CoA N-acyltransferase [Phanerochaete sordida]|uniref:Acyl-CoA N-acyltransferase n=1 Tax=Phanerochaete sordida TaxID=48140 RepID=A0A9P3FX92_9APHY|nr:acyl-CoA N-acyltransferase [Phanerochaete sordida]
MTDSYSVRRVTEASEEYIQQATAALDDAFGYQFFSEGLDKNRDIIFACIRAHITGGLLEGEVYVAETTRGVPVGVSVWFGPGHKFLDSKVQQEAGWNQTMEQLPPHLQKWWDDFVGEYNNNAEKFYGEGVKRDSYHLQLIGVHHDHQRRGLATRLMSPAHDKAHSEGVKCVLESANPTTRGIYQSLGYAHVGTGTFKSPSDETFEMYYMVRDP